MVSAQGYWGRRYFDLSEVPSVFGAPRLALRLLILADDSHPANAVQDHIRSFTEFSFHRLSVINTRQVTKPDPDFDSKFDAVLIHYSIYILADSYFSCDWQDFVATFRGPVAVIHEDEYHRIDDFTRKFAELGVQAVFSCLDSTATLERVYGESSLPNDTLFFSCLPGYIPSNFSQRSPPPISGRHFDVVYRGRTLRPELGRFAQEKRLIGERFLERAQSYGIVCDISSEESDRIYGDGWQEFLLSGKAMLGVEGGASIFDFDGAISESVNRYLKYHPQAEFEEVWTSVLSKYEGNIQFRTITPKFFEAIAAKTVLILYPGRYRDVLQPDRHFIPLERDGSNLDEVAAKLKDDDFLQEMADRTFSEILTDTSLSSRFYVAQIDSVLSALAEHTGLGKLYRLSQATKTTLNRFGQQLAKTENRLRDESLRLETNCAELATAKSILESTRVKLELVERRAETLEAELQIYREQLCSIDAASEDRYQLISSEAHMAELLKKMFKSKLKRILRLQR